MKERREFHPRFSPVRQLELLNQTLEPSSIGGTTLFNILAEYSSSQSCKMWSICPLRLCIVDNLNAEPKCFDCQATLKL